MILSNIKYTKKLKKHANGSELGHNVTLRTPYEKKFDIKYSTKRIEIVGNDYQLDQKPLISYIINVNASNSNTTITITEKNGGLKGYFTAGVLGFKGSQKTKKYTLITILKQFSYKFNFLNNKTVLLKFKGITKDQKLFVRKLKEKVSIKSIHYNNLLPHNGCRPKKLKRM